MTRHVSVEKLARFREADLGRPAARRVAAHLAGCAACQAESDALAQIPQLLASTIVPPIPAHLAARIETALATESAHRTATADQAAASAAARRGRVPRPRPRLRPARLVATAAVVVVAGVAGYSLLHATTGSTSSAVSSPAAGVASRVPAPSRAPLGGTRQGPEAGQGEAPQVSAAPVFGPVQRYGSGGHAALFAPVRSGTDYLPGSLARQVSATIAAVAAAHRHETLAPGVAPAATRLSGCVGRIAGGRLVLLVDQASYQGAAAIIIVTGPPADGQAWVVGPGCSATASDILAHQAVRP
jgi:hypothetical protein